MKTLRLFLFALTTLVVMAALTFSNPALADCGKKSRLKFLNGIMGMHEMDMGVDMPMCCKMKMNHKNMKGHKNEGSKSESMDEDEAAGMKDEKEGQAGKNKRKKSKTRSVQ